MIACLFFKDSLVNCKQNSMKESYTGEIVLLRLITTLKVCCRQECIMMERGSCSAVVVTPIQRLLLFCLPKAASI